MPVLQVKTTSSKVLWESPDGQRKIHALEMDYEGKPVTANTFSDAIAEVGWEGKVETYEREGKGDRPAQTFVKQPPKEDGAYPARTQGGSSQGTSGGRSYVPKDEKAIQAMWSIGQAIQLVVATKPKDILGTVEVHAQELFSMVDRVKAVQPEVPSETETKEDVDPDKITIDDIAEVFDGAEKAAEEVGENPWQPKT